LKIVKSRAAANPQEEQEVVIQQNQFCYWTEDNHRHQLGVRVRQLVAEE